MINVQKTRKARDRRYGPKVLVTKREMLLAQLLLRVCDTIAGDDRDQDFVFLVDCVKPIAEGVMRDGS